MRVWVYQNGTCTKQVPHQPFSGRICRQSEKGLPEDRRVQ